MTLANLSNAWCLSDISWCSSDMDWGVYGVVLSAGMTLAILSLEAWRYLGRLWLWECCEKPIMLVKAVLCEFVKVRTTWYILGQVGISYGGDFNFPSSKRGSMFFYRPMQKTGRFRFYDEPSTYIHEHRQWRVEMAVCTVTDAVECLHRALGTRKMCLLSYRHWKGSIPSKKDNSNVWEYGLYDRDHRVVSA